MKNILAENMRRFRTKNLNEQNDMPTPEPDALVAPNRKLEEPPAEPKRITKLTDITDGNKFNLFKDAGGVTPLYTGTIVDAMKLQDINDGRVLFDINIQGVGTKTIGWSGSYTASGPQRNPNANQFLLFKNNNDAHAWYNGDVKPAGLLNKVITGNPVIKGSTLVYNDKLGKFLKAHHGQASYDPTAAN